tara:strand:+ start:2120 stop:2488 length:369 start_codon:yes stop_codon:yes gene_type:complete
MNNENLEDITLELLINKKGARKLKTKKLDHEIMFELDLESYKQDIMEIFKDLLDGTKKNIHPDVKEQFINFCKASVTHIQNKEVFDSNPFVSEENDTNIKEVKNQTVQSFWSKELVLKKDED